MQRPLVECVANFSEGRDPEIINVIAEAITGVPGAALLHRTMDSDHNRSVLTFAGSPQAVVAAAVRAVAIAAQRIDLNQHTGVHPRIGAADVVPFVPVEHITLEQCAELAHQAGREIWRVARVPVYFYEAAALHPERKRLEQVRRGQFEGLRQEVLTDPARRPDIGGPELHPTAGAVVVGARRFLIAYNVNLDTEDLDIARSIARRIRTSSGGYPHVKALGLPLGSRRQVQVSMNLTDYTQTPLHVVYEAIRVYAAAAGTSIASSELIGLIPREALERTAEAALRMENFRPSVVLETRIAEALPWSVEDLLRHASPDAVPALSAGLAMELCCRVSDSFEPHRAFFWDATRLNPASDLEAVEWFLRTAERANQLEAAIAQLLPSPDTAMASALIIAARQGALAFASGRLDRIADTSTRSVLESRIASLK